MATRSWLAVDGNWENVNNWSGGSVPAASDDVIINAGSVDITTNLDQPTIKLTSLKIGAGFTGDLGSTGNSLQIGAADVWIAGGGAVWLQGATGVELDTVNIDKPNRSENAVVLSGYAGDINLIRGRCTLAAGSASTTATRHVRVLYRDRMDTDTYLTIAATVGDLDEVYIAGGHVECQSVLTNLYMQAGSFRTTLGGITTVRMFGGIFYWENDETITTVWAIAGKVDATQNLQSTTTPTITNLYQFPTAIVDLRSGLGNIVTTAKLLLATLGPRIDMVA